LVRQLFNNLDYVDLIFFQDALLSRWTGNGKEITELNLEIPDENVDPDALHHALGSLYCDEIEIEPSRAVNILAAATFLQHQGLCDHLNSEMKGNSSFYQTSDCINS